MSCTYHGPCTPCGSSTSDNDHTILERYLMILHGLLIPVLSQPVTHTVLLAHCVWLVGQSEVTRLSIMYPFQTNG